MSGDALAEQIVTGYLQLLQGWTGRLHWTYSIFDDLVRDRPEVAWPMLLELVARAPDESLNVLAAGPLEDFLSRHGPRVIDAVEAEAATNLRLRQTLAMVWRLTMTDDVWARVQALADPSLSTELDGKPPEGWTSSRIQVRLDEMPVFESGAITTASAERLLAAVREAKRDGPTAWDSPVGVEIRMWTGPEALPVAPVEVLNQIVDILVTGGILTETALVREARIEDQRGASPDLTLEVARMAAEQVHVFDSTASFEEEMEMLGIGEMRAELEAMRAELESELTGNALRSDGS